RVRPGDLLADGDRDVALDEGVGGRGLHRLVGGEGGSRDEERGEDCGAEGAEGRRGLSVIPPRRGGNGVWRQLGAVRRQLQTVAPQLGSSSATRNEEPQPHEATTFGFDTSKPEPMKFSV